MAQILIVQRTGDDVFVYTEDLQHYTRVQANAEDNCRLPSKRVDITVFDNECLAARALADGEWTSVVIV